jgi:hypothetical protein
LAKQYNSIEAPIAKFIGRQHMFFVGSAADGSRINVSPKGLDAFRVVDANKVIYLDRTGSGNETAAHLRADGRLTVMFCAFEGAPMILRLFGRGTSHLLGSEKFNTYIESHFAGSIPSGARQIVELAVDLVQTSCGYAVPEYEFQNHRETLVEWADRKGDDGIRAYWAEKNLKSIDGLPTGFETIAANS